MTHLFSRSRAFSTIELMIVVVVIAILSSVAGMNYSDTRARSRDAARKETIESYRAAMEQFKGVKGNYFVHSTKRGSAGAPSVCNPVTIDINAYKGYRMQGADDGCTGYVGGGAGRMTRKSSVDQPFPNYPATFSIADALVDEQFLNEVKTDPLEANNPFTTQTTRDFYLALCKPDSFAAQTPQQAQEFTIYVNLEKSDPTGSEAQDARRQCGASDTPGTWDIAGA